MNNVCALFSPLPPYVATFVSVCQLTVFSSVHTYAHVIDPHE